MKSPTLDHRQSRSLRELDDSPVLDEQTEDVDNARAGAIRVLDSGRSVENATSCDYASRVVCFEAADDRSKLLQRGLINSLPLDVLGLIFEAATGHPEQNESGVCAGECYSHPLSHMPFVLTAVCRRWRTQALAQPGLWTYISAPDCLAPRGATLHLERINLLIRRSRCMPLDILIFWMLEDDAECSWNEGIPLIDALSPHAARWRTFELWLPDGVGDNRHVAAFKGPMPLLERLCFSTSNPEDSAGECLRYAPKLQELFIWGPNAFHPAENLELTSLRRLTLWFHPSLELTWSIIMAAAPTLESLVLAADSHHGLSVPDTPLLLPRLKSLTLADGEADPFPYLKQLKLPVLSHLTLTGEMIVPAAAPFLQRVAQTVRMLTLAGAVEPQHVAPLAVLAGVEELWFDNAGSEYEPDCSYTVNDCFFSAGARGAWPKLASVGFSAMGTFEFNDGAGVFRFIRARTDGALRDFKARGAPEWFNAEVARLLQPGRS
ncbi:hypothetical protein AURDEDRAFT_127936 [Auricularia subglabra TFB-10046 SS5]|nr:hypothetical protein AURDEDRAFT_127936 [Auricularia subglabra TFB-10046 SS5]